MLDICRTKIIHIFYDIKGFIYRNVRSYNFKFHGLFARIILDISSLSIYNNLKVHIISKIIDSLHLFHCQVYNFCCQGY